MFTRNPKKLAIAALMACQSMAASATIITQGLALNQVYGSNSSNLSYSSTFDAAAVLGTASFNADYTVNSALVQFDWMDNHGDPYSLTGASGWSNVYGDYAYMGYNGNYIYLRPETGTASEQYATPSESASIAFGAQIVNSAPTTLTAVTASQSNSNYSTYDGGYSGYYQYYSYRCGFFSWCSGSYWNPGAQYYTTHNDTLTRSYNDYSGNFGVDIDLLALGGNALNGFLQTGMLPFTMTMNGNAILTGATLSLDVTQTLRADQTLLSDTSAVPEPGTLMLLGLGLVAVGWSRQRSLLAR